MAELAVTKTEAARHRPAFNQRRREALTGYLFASPWIFGFLVLTLGPMIFSLYASFTDYSITGTTHWKGWANYSFILQHDADFPIALRNTFYYVLVKTPAIIIFSLFIALLLNL